MFSTCHIAGAVGTLVYLMLSLGALTAGFPPDPSSYDPTIELAGGISGTGLNNRCGYGVKIDYPWNEHALFETEYTHYFDHSDKPRHFVLLTGARVGIRRGKVGVFAKLQPGVLRGPRSVTRFAVSAGGVLEIHLDNRLYTRLDSDTFIAWLGHPEASVYRRGSIGIAIRH